MDIAEWIKQAAILNVNQSKIIPISFYSIILRLFSEDMNILLLRRNVQCGSLQCKDGDSTPIIEGMNQLYSRTIISIRGIEYECK